MEVLFPQKECQGGRYAVFVFFIVLRKIANIGITPLSKDTKSAWFQMAVVAVAVDSQAATPVAAAASVHWVMLGLQRSAW